MRISTATSVFVNYPLDAAVEQVIQAGLDGIDLWCGRPHLFRNDYPAGTLAELKKRIESSGLAVVSVLPAFFRYPFSLSSPVDAIRVDSVNYMKDCIDNAVLMGAHHVLVVPTNTLYGQTLEDSRGTFIRSLETVCDHAEMRGMRLGIEVVYPRLSGYLNHTSQAIQVIRDLQSDMVGVVIDTGHLNLSKEGLQPALDGLGEYLWQVHVNDNNSREQQNAIPGDGTFDFEEMMGLLRRYDYQGFLTLELGWSYSFDPYPAVVEAVKRMRGYMETRE
ncbi:MAG: sugar phosphate isomerase/epimerase [Firmicutes bacterium]|nr:sugar phosphate isomerase/epimerase [Bacillota bacterium]